MWIYAIRNAVNDKVYVGQTTGEVERRWYGHRWRLDAGTHENTHLQRAWHKHGSAAFSFAVIDNASDVASLNVAERRWIAFYDSTNPLKGYNKTKGGENKTRSPETRKAISESKKGWKPTPEQLARFSESHKGCTPWNKGKKMSAEYSEIARRNRQGKPHSEETKRRMSEARRGKSATWQIGKPLTPEHRARISQGMKRRKEARNAGME